MSLRSIQHHHFKDEIETLSKLDGNDKQFQDRKNARERNGLVKLSSNLHRLDPFVDTQGLLRVVGRLKSATSSYSIKHPLSYLRRVNCGSYNSSIMRSSITRVTA